MNRMFLITLFFILISKLSLASLKSPLCVSLGSNCTAAYQLRNSNLRTFAYPFDWILSRDINGLFKAIKTDFTDYFLKENLINSAAAQVIDTQYNMYYIHDFPYHTVLVEGKIVPEIDKNWLEYYPLNKEKYDRRIARFRQLKYAQETIIFFRYFYTTKAEALILKALLEEYLFPKKFTLVVIGDTQEYKEKWNIAGIENFFFIARSWKEMAHPEHFIKICNELNLPYFVNKFPDNELQEMYNDFLINLTNFSLPIE